MSAIHVVLIAFIVATLGGCSDYIQTREREPPCVAIPAQTALLDSHSAKSCPIYSPDPEAQSRQASYG
jgi:hypothetical protein